MNQKDGGVPHNRSGIQMIFGEVHFELLLGHDLRALGTVDMGPDMGFIVMLRL